jgi:hypothetical protein
MPSKKDVPEIVVAAPEDGDWEELYVNGKSHGGNHSLEWPRVLGALGIKYEFVEVSEEWLEKHHHAFPLEAKNLPKPKSAKK